MSVHSMVCCFQWVERRFKKRGQSTKSRSMTRTLFSKSTSSAGTLPPIEQIEVIVWHFSLWDKGCPSVADLTGLQGAVGEDIDIEQEDAYIHLEGTPSRDGSGVYFLVQFPPYQQLLEEFVDPKDGHRYPSVSATVYPRPKQIFIQSLPVYPGPIVLSPDPQEVSLIRSGAHGSPSLVFTFNTKQNLRKFRFFPPVHEGQFVDHKYRRKASQNLIGSSCDNLQPDFNFAEFRSISNDL